MQAEPTELMDIHQKQDQVILALLEKPGVEEAAEATGIGKSTIYRWLHEEQFRRRYFEARREAVSQAISRLQQVMTGAVDVLYGLACDNHVAPQVRVAAAKTIIDRAIKGMEVEDLEIRITRLEDQEK